MTTIAFRDGVMAGDGRVTGGGWISSEHGQKLFRLPDNAVAGFSTDNQGKITEWLGWYGPGRSDLWEAKTLTIDGLYVLVAYPDGRLLYYSGTNAVDNSHEPFDAIGSGWPVARGALLTGATAQEAVRIAAQVDLGTGPIVTTLTVPNWRRP